MENFTLKTSDNLELHLSKFVPENPKAVVQIIHGLKEHRKRYFHFAEFLYNNGFAVVLSDNRGNGESCNDDNILGCMKSIDLIVEDQFMITKYIKENFPNIPNYILGHSFGSMISRCYIQKYDNHISKLVLSGTVGYNPGVLIAYPIANLIIKFKGPLSYSKILSSFADNGDISWVCSNEETMEKYRNDPFCTGYKYSSIAIHTIFDAMKRIFNKDLYKVQNKDLKILSIAGEKDPVTRFKKGIEKSINTLKDVGYKQVESIVYKDMLHEVLNETEKDKVYADVLKFFNS